MFKLLRCLAGIALALFGSSLLGAEEQMSPQANSADAPASDKTPAPAVIKANLNGLAITIDAQTGGIVGLRHEGPGQILESPAAEASAIDVAYPIPKFEPLRLTSRYSKGAQVKVSDKEITIHYDRLGASREVFAQPGAVAATIRLQATEDGRSIILSAQVENQSQVAIRQVIFPDFSGLLPVAGETGTIFKTGGFGSAPFAELQPSEGRMANQFCMDSTFSAIEYQSGGMFSGMWLRWLDLGGLNGGLSMYARRWGWDDPLTVRLQRHPTESKLRLLVVNPVTIAPGASWTSGDYVLTPHAGGWAKGIEPYREWVKEHLHRKYPVPQHVREGLGFRTLWMCQSWPDDPQDAVWTVASLPAAAQEAKEHGLTEMSLWAWNKAFELPLPDVFPHLGTKAQFVQTIADCRKNGVNIAPWISVVQADYTMATKYGLTPPESGGWAQHTETIPRFQAPYTTRYRSVGVPMENELWQREALAACLGMVKEGLVSIGWDQVWSTKEGHFQRITRQVVDAAKQADPNSTFSGEQLWNIEDDATFLDYTWDWGGYRDCQAFTNAFPAPRVNMTIDHSALEVKRAFTDGLYMNIMPTKPGSVNGSAHIPDYPELSQALKQCAKLRQQFLPYFTEGTLIGNCILRESAAPELHVCAWVRPDRILVLALNLGGEASYPFTMNPGPWFNDNGPAPEYKIQTYDTQGTATTSVTQPGGPWQGQTGPLHPVDLAIYEITRR